METQDDAILENLAALDELAPLLSRAVRGQRRVQGADRVVTPVVATLVEFDLEDRPLVRSNQLIAGERLIARTTVALRRAQLGSNVLVLCENGDARLPIIVGVIELRTAAAKRLPAADDRVQVQADDERFVVNAEREIVLRCGDSSITLTRAGKVIIKGKYIVSRSSGYNRIKGAAVDIN